MLKRHPAGLVGKPHIPKLEALDFPIRHDPVRILGDGGLIVQEIPEILDEKAVLHALQKRFRVSDQDPGNGGHKGGEHREIRQGHGLRHHGAAGPVKNHALEYDHEGNVQVAPAKQHVFHQILVHGSGNPRLGVLLFFLHHMENIRHTQFLGVISQMDDPVHIVRDPAENHGLLIDPVGQLIQGVGKHEVADDGRQRKNDHVMVDPEHHHPGDRHRYRTDQDMPPIINGLGQPLVAVRHGHHIAVVKIAVLKAGQICVPRLLIQGVVKPLINLHIRHRGQIIDIPAVEQTDSAKQPGRNQRKGKDFLKTASVFN